MLVRCGFGFIADASALFALKNFDGSAIMLILLVLLILSNIATYLVLGATLLLSKRVNEHFNT
jgi:hypothetical protein